MQETYIFLSVIAILLIVILIRVFKKEAKEESIELIAIKNSVAALTQHLKDTERNLKTEFITNRKESADIATGLRTELGNQLNQFTQTFLEQLTVLTKLIEEKFTAFQNVIDTNNKDSRKELK